MPTLETCYTRKKRQLNFCICQTTVDRFKNTLTFNDKPFVKKKKKVAICLSPYKKMKMGIWYRTTQTNILDNLTNCYYTITTNLYDHECGT